ncbi:MAG: site-specific DNA-methyltransferase [Thermoplasmata archaeon]
MSNANYTPLPLPRDLVPSIVRGHVLDVLPRLPANCIQTVVTSTPYWGQRDYQTEAQIWSGDVGHAHDWAATEPRRARSVDDQGKNSAYKRTYLQHANYDPVRFQGADPANYDARGGEICSCGAWRGELGQEPTPELFVDHLTAVFAEVFRVLRDDGTLWLNIAGTYATHPAGLTGERRWAKSWLKGKNNRGAEQSGSFDKRAPGWKEKEYVPIPWLLGLALHDAGWTIRSDVQWWKLNGKHENVADRPFRAHEYITMFTKTADPFYNEEAVRQPYVPSTIREVGVAYRGRSKKVAGSAVELSLYETAGAQDPSELKRRIVESLAERGGSMLPDVWFMATGNGGGQHVAVFPETLPELCITASSRVGDLVLDPFSGSGTTCAVARRLARRSIGIELSALHVQQSVARCASVPEPEHAPFRVQRSILEVPA